MGRISALERRESVIRAAIAEFARMGYHGTSTAAIAERVGVTQPYLFQLSRTRRRSSSPLWCGARKTLAWLSRGRPPRCRAMT